MWLEILTDLLPFHYSRVIIDNNRAVYLYQLLIPIYFEPEWEITDNRLQLPYTFCNQIKSTWFSIIFIAHFPVTEVAGKQMVLNPRSCNPFRLSQTCQIDRGDGWRPKAVPLIARKRPNEYVHSFVNAPCIHARRSRVLRDWQRQAVVRRLRNSLMTLCRATHTSKRNGLNFVPRRVFSLLGVFSRSSRCENRPECYTPSNYKLDLASVRLRGILFPKFYFPP